MARAKKTTQRPLTNERPPGQPSVGLEAPRGQVSHRESRVALRSMFWEAGFRVCPNAFDELREIFVPESILEEWELYCNDGWAYTSNDDELILEAAILAWCERFRLCAAKKSSRLRSVAGTDGVVHQIESKYFDPSPAWAVARARETLLAWKVGFRSSSDVRPLFEATRRLSEYNPKAVGHNFEISSLGADVNTRARERGWGRALQRRPEHIEWAATRRFCGMRAEAIATSLKEWPDCDVIRKAISRIDSDLDLPSLLAGSGDLRCNLSQ